MGLVFERQWVHALALAVLLFGVSRATTFETVQNGCLFGLDSVTWLWIAVGLAVAHQVFVWFCWRTELHHRLLSRTMGDHGFTAYAVIFSVLGIGRVAAVVLTAVSNRDALPFEHPGFLKVVALLLLIPSIYLFYSVRRYFGFRRAFGIDHFDSGYAQQPFVKRGIFRFTNNGMYVYGFLVLWAVALWFASPAALVAAGFNHLYIWVHYVATERPDMRRIYGASVLASPWPCAGARPRP